MKKSRDRLTGFGLLLLILSACCTAVRADGLLKGSAEIRVSPLDELTVIDPGVNSTGKPEPVVTDGHVETAPTIIVHNYYYTGDRDFRGPVLKGGPCILVIEHPYTCERMYLDVQMLPGSPRVVYRKCAIEYHFGKDAICIQLHNPVNLLHPNRPVVRNLSGNRRIQQARYTEQISHSREWPRKT